jgi:ABC-type uncharacterized transport system permease subunit
VRRLREALPLLPFLTIVVIFLIIPTVTVIVTEEQNKRATEYLADNWARAIG